MDFGIRAAIAADYPAIAALYHEADAFHAAGAPDIFCLPAAPLLPRETFERALTDPQRAIIVAEQAGEVLGLVDVALREAPPSQTTIPTRTAYVQELVVHAQHRGTGIGRALMYQAEQWARAREADAIELSVWEFPGSAVPFYEQLGYTTRMRRMRRAL